MATSAGESDRTTIALQRTALFELHRECGARFTEFGGWEMPLSYPKGTVAEHLACRQDAAIFDVSHLGTLELGDDGFEQIQQTCTNDLGRIGPARTQYTLVCNDGGGITDDCIVWWLPDGRIHLLPNAANTDSVRSVIDGVDTTKERALLAVQGPNARSRLRLILQDGADTPRHRVSLSTFEGSPVVIAGTGYTGEDGLEISLEPEVASSFFKAALRAGIEPAGLGARDTLRLEAGLPLHGHEISPLITPLQANLGWAVGWTKPSFTGRDALGALRERGIESRIVGIISRDRRPLRDGAVVSFGGLQIGRLTSGGYSPIRALGIGLALCGVTRVQLGDEVSVTLRGNQLVAEIRKPPFFEHPE